VVEPGRELSNTVLCERVWSGVASVCALYKRFSRR